jgi:hypothetical protein
LPRCFLFEGTASNCTWLARKEWCFCGT